MHHFLQTGRLVLRPFTADDAELLVELDSDPAVMRYLTGGEPTSPELVRQRDLPGILRGDERWAGSFGVFAAEDRDSGAFVGWFLLRPESGGPLDESSSATGCAKRPGAGDWPPRAAGPCWTRPFRRSTCAWCGARRCPRTRPRSG